MVDFTAAAATAKRLVDANGRTVTLQRFDQSPADVARPYEGPADPDAAPDFSLDVVASFVPLSGAASLGLSITDEELLKRTAEVCLVAPGPTQAEQFERMSQIVDGGIKKGITFVEKLRPADTTLLYFFGVSH